MLGYTLLAKHKKPRLFACRRLVLSYRMQPTMPVPDLPSQPFHDPQKYDIRENEADVSKPRPPQSASRYEGSHARYVESPPQEAGLLMPIITVQDLALDTALRRVTRGTREIHLTEEQYLLLHLLMRREGTKVHPRELLQLQKLGPEAEQGLIEAQMRQLRAEVDFADEAQLIYRCGPFYQLGGPPPPQTVADMPKAINDELDALFERMQTPAARAGMKAAFDASPEEMGKAAVAAARKRD